MNLWSVKGEAECKTSRTRDKADCEIKNRSVLDFSVKLLLDQVKSIQSRLKKHQVSAKDRSDVKVKIKLFEIEF